MLSSEDKMAIWILTGMTASLTIFFNLYILLTNLRSYRQNGHWLPCETIITALSVVSGTHQLVSYFWITMDKMDTDCLLNSLPFSILLVTVHSLKFSIMWITAFLTFYYSTKLVIEPIHCYTKIQEAILKHVTTVVLIIPLCGFASCMPLLVVLSQHNSTETNPNPDCGSLATTGIQGMAYLAYYLLMSDIIPGLLMVKSSISISVHLAIHLRHMKASTNSFHSPKLGSEMRVIRMNLGLVSVFLCFLVVDLYVHYMSMVKRQNVLVLTILFSSVYTAVNSLVLIYGKTTFWKELLHQFSLLLDVFPCLACFKVPETKHNLSAT
ncbi:uncharacterized protein LOC118776092 [Megalops cyprinoides]|uniref:uncharacterized protein LOC118776092 n=1 Tax=Megalops cyprinoides TaxID=118141 RepID=UPI0018652641|nr:uncharacterized protein LOC118776092 [Megalops cyprinoides]